MRRVVWKFLWGLIFQVFSPRLQVVSSLPPPPVILVANHISHADTAAIQYALTSVGHTRVLTAGAEDYFFSTPVRSLFARAIGVFPFPRRGRQGIIRSRRLLARGFSILIFPQGTRDGGPFRAGVGHIAAWQWPVVPVLVEGTLAMLQKGSCWPRRADVRVSFGRPVVRFAAETAPDFAARLEAAVFSMENDRAA